MKVFEDATIENLSNFIDINTKCVFVILSTGIPQHICIAFLFFFFLSIEDTALFTN